MKTSHFKRLILASLALVFSVFIAAPVLAQAPVSICVLKDRNQGGVTVTDCIPVDSTNPLPTSGSGGGGGATAANQTNGTQKSQQVDGAGNVQPAGDTAARSVFVTPGQTGSTSTMATAAPTAASFGTLLASNASRKACLIQNTGTTTGYVYFGANGSATTGNSFVLSAGGSISCTNNNVTLTDNVAGTCASGTCAFVISSQ